MVITLFACTGQGQAHYSVVSIKKILRLLNSFHKVSVKRRWAFQCLRDLLDAGLIARKSRFRNNTAGHISQIPSMITFTLKGARYLVSKRVSGAGRLLKSIMKFVVGGDARWPQAEFVEHKNDHDHFKPSADDWKMLFGVLHGDKV